MASFKVNVTNKSKCDGISLSPVGAWGFGSCVPAESTVNFSFESIPNSDSITLALMLLAESSEEGLQIAGIHTEGGICQIQCDSIKPRLMEITNLCDQSITDVIISDGHTVEEWLDKGIRQKL
ncbi:MAG: hypothetical protein GY940_16820 [bacterium]|nr:hypothetical protein [bacterium]